jgi:6,7-dimethyl-8-ribityllumazine synthase
MGKGISNEIDRIDGIAARQVVGSLDASGMRFGIVVARFNDELTGELARSACRCLEKNGAPSMWCGFRVPTKFPS